ncbi:triose-phosphate isomerase [Ranunculus cassubicifolius]
MFSFLGSLYFESRNIKTLLQTLLNGTSDEIKKIVTMLNEAEVPSADVVEVVVSPPYVFLPFVKSLLRSDFHVAAQNCWVKKGGAFTGEVSAEMLVNLSIPWVILGHSEKKGIFVGDKVAYALSQGIKVIACVGETLEERESGSTMKVVASQIKAIAVSAPLSVSPVAEIAESLRQFLSSLNSAIDLIAFIDTLISLEAGEPEWRCTFNEAEYKQNQERARKLDRGGRLYWS